MTGGAHEMTVPRGEHELVIAAYAALQGPSVSKGDREIFFAEFGRGRNVCVWEVPFDDDIDPLGSEWLLKQLGSSSQLLLETIPGTMRRMRRDPRFGLASGDEESRRAAIDFIRTAQDRVMRMADRFGRQVVRGIQLHSAPRPTNGSSIRALRDSLHEIAAWEWGGVQLILEHCDAERPDHPPVKGFLPIEHEVELLRELRGMGERPMGMLVNWGRSALEGRSAATPVTHARLAHEAGVLEGLTFSGVSGVESSRGGAWADVHLPMGTVAEGESSLLTQARIRQTLAAAGGVQGLGAIGLKVSTPPVATIAERIALLASSADSVLAALVKR